MFGKLLKYEFKSIGKWYLILYAIAISLSLVIGMWIRTLNENYLESTSSSNTDVAFYIFVFTLIAYVAVVVSIAISTLFLIINRFRKNIYGREGYLTMTLPVNSHQILLSKLTSAVIWNILAGVVAALSVFIIIALSSLQNLYGVSYTLSTIMDLPGATLFTFNSFVDGIVGILLIYFATSIGQLFKDHRVLMAFVAYFGINMVVGLFTTIFYLNQLEALGTAESFVYLNPLTLVLNILLGIGYYFGTHYIMTKKLNLQ